MASPYPHLMRPIRIASMELKNRVALAPMGTRLASRDDLLTERMRRFYTRVAEGGTGLIITGVAAVSKEGTVGPGMNSLYDPSMFPGFRALAEAVHDAGAKLAVHLMHAGMEAFAFYIKRKRLVSPSGGVFAPNRARFQGMDLDRTTLVSHPMDIADIRRVRDDFAAAATRAREAGADAVEINGAQGFLLQQFYSPHFNQRSDEYGGDFERRMRFPLEVIEAVRGAVGEGFPVLFRMVATEGPGGAVSVEDARRIAGALERAGVDALHVTAGRGVSPDVWTLMMPIAEDGHTPIAEEIGAVREAVGIPVIGVQRIVDPDEAESMLASGKADMVALGRGLVADPDWVAKAAEGRSDDIRKCIGCLQGCIGSQITAGYANCLQNPDFGGETDARPSLAPRPKRMLVVGGGPAGLEAALVAGTRGHEVLLCERDGALGGQWRLASAPPGKEDYRWVVDWRARELEKLGNVSVRLHCEVTPDLVESYRPDVVLLATGSVPIVPPIEGADGPRVTSAHEVLEGRGRPGRNAAVIGGAATGCETAHYLARRGLEVTLIEAAGSVGMGEEPARRVWLLRRLAEHGVRVLTNSAVRRISEDGEVWIERADQSESLGCFDSIVLAVGVRPHDPLSESIAGMAPEVHVIGDAYVMPTNALDAIHHASRVARAL